MKCDCKAFFSVLYLVLLEYWAQVLRPQKKKLDDTAGLAGFTLCGQRLRCMCEPMFSSTLHKEPKAESLPSFSCKPHADVNDNFKVAFLLFPLSNLSLITLTRPSEPFSPPMWTLLWLLPPLGKGRLKILIKSLMHLGYIMLLDVSEKKKKNQPIFAECSLSMKLLICKHFKGDCYAIHTGGEFDCLLIS